MQPSREFSHVALGVGRGDGPLATRFLEHLGLEVRDNGPSLVGDPWYTAHIHPDLHDGHMGNVGFFVVPISDEQVELEAATATLPELQGYLDEKRRKPDSTSHVALHYRSLDQLEEAVRALRNDDELQDRVAVVTIRPEEGDAGVDDRLDRSDVFGDAVRVRYLRNDVQVFLQTDLVAAGLLALRQSFELNAVVT